MFTDGSRTARNKQAAIEQGGEGDRCALALAAGGERASVERNMEHVYSLSRGNDNQKIYLKQVVGKPTFLTKMTKTTEHLNIFMIHSINSMICTV